VLLSRKIVEKKRRPLGNTNIEGLEEESVTTEKDDQRGRPYDLMEMKG
jgi:hypothetical protein